jgi:eukaryotic-like serine/threonine-protein kinase
MMPQSRARGGSTIGALARCLDPSELEALALGVAPEAARLEAEQHLDGCAECARVLAEYLRIYVSSDSAHVPSRAPARPDAEPPLELGRYRLGARLGAGAMGVVFAAHDPELDRPIAIKLLHPSAAPDDEEQRTRLLREAQVMAKLSHPNVVTVYDVGRFRERVFLAIELIEGRTLSAWLEEKPRTRDEILRVFVEAGRGLEAAHAAGIVHRDFKPDNVLINRDGHAKVTDFGLARPSVSPEDSPAEAPEAPATTRVGAIWRDFARRTRTGALVGTPAYMAPEQLRGARADAHSDQFAFSVSLYEAVFGRRPFTSAEPARDPMIPASAPRWLARLLRRGLAPSPADRFPSMTALLRELERDRLRAARTALAALGVVLGATAVVFVLRAFLPSQARVLPALASSAPSTSSVVAPCAIADLSAAWNRARGAELERALRDRAAVQGGRVGPRLVAALDTYRDRYDSARRQVCERRDSSAVEAGRACFERRRRALQALLGQMARPEHAALYFAESVVDRLPAPEACLAARPLPRPAPDKQAEVALLLDATWAERLELELVHPWRTVEQITVPLGRATANGFAPLVAEAEVVAARAYRRRGDASSAAALLAAAAGRARAAGQDEIAWEAAVEMIGLQALELFRPFDEWAKLATALLPAQSPGARLELDLALGNAYVAHGRVHDAKELLERALDHVKGQRPPGELARLDVALSDMYLDWGDTRAALSYASQSLERARSWDKEDPRRAEARRALARALFASGDKQAALAEQAAARSLTNAYPLHTEAVAQQRDEVAGMLEELGQHAAARKSYESARFTRTAIDTENPRAAISDVRLAGLALREGQAQQAARALERTLERLQKLHGKADPLLVVPLRELAEARAAAGAMKPALRALDRAKAIIGAHHGALSPLAGTIETQMGELAARAGDRRAALEHHDAAFLPLSTAFGSGHPRLEANVLTRAELAHALGRREEAARLFGVVLTGMERRLGKQHASVEALRARLAELGVKPAAP